MSVGKPSMTLRKADWLFLQEVQRKTAYSQEDHDRLTLILLYEYARESGVMRRIAEDMRNLKGPFSKDARLPPHPVFRWRKNEYPRTMSCSGAKDFVAECDQWEKLYEQYDCMPSRLEAEDAVLERHGLTPDNAYYWRLYYIVRQACFPATSWCDLRSEDKENLCRYPVEGPPFRVATLRECRQLVVAGENSARAWQPLNEAQEVMGSEFSIRPVSELAQGGFVVAFRIDSTETPEKTANRFHKWLSEYQSGGGYQPSRLPLVGREPAIPRIGAQDKYTKLLALAVMRCWSLYGPDFLPKVESDPDLRLIADHLAKDAEVACRKRRRRPRGWRGRFLDSPSFQKRVTYTLPAVAASFLHRMFPFEAEQPYHYPPSMCRVSIPFRRR